MEPILVFVENDIQYRGTRTHGDPYEKLKIYNDISNVYVSSMKDINFRDMFIIKDFICPSPYINGEETVELDADDEGDYYSPPIWRSTLNLCQKLNANYEVAKFSPSHSKTGLNLISRYTLLQYDSEYMAYSVPIYGYTAMADAFIETIYKYYLYAISNHQIAKDSILNIDFPIEYFHFLSDKQSKSPVKVMAGGMDNIYSKYGLLLFKNINALLLAFFLRNDSLFIDCVDIIDDYLPFFSQIPEIHRNPLRYAILQYAKNLNLPSENILLLENALYKS